MCHLLCVGRLISKSILFSARLSLLSSFISSIQRPITHVMPQGEGNIGISYRLFYGVVMLHVSKKGRLNS